MAREKVVAVKHHYSCGGYWLAEEWEPGKYWRVSPKWGQGSVLSEEQARTAGAVEFVDNLPDGSRVLNA